MRVPVYIQKKHIHLSQIEAEKLFGKWYVFWIEKQFTQPWEYFTKEKLTIKWPKWTIENIDIIMPFRKFTQVEISPSDNETLWINAKETKSWELKHAEHITIIWPNWSVYLNNCAIIAEKHIHMSVADAKDFGFRNNQMVNLKTPWNNWKIIENVRIRTNDKFAFDLHLNEDEWKRFWLETNDWTEILK
jgi:propanediol utilization protein